MFFIFIYLYIIINYILFNLIILSSYNKIIKASKALLINLSTYL